MASSNSHASAEGTSAQHQCITSSETRAALDSFSTALVLLPPPSIQTRVNTLRSANDKSYPRWTAHVTLIFPFVHPEHLPRYLDAIRSAIRNANLTPFLLCLDTVGHFRQREYETVYLGQTTGKSTGNEEVQRLWTILADTLGYRGRAFIPHITLGQTSHRSEDRELLRDKGERILQGGVPSWTVNSVIVLRKDETDGGKMKVAEEIFFHPTDVIADGTTIATEESYSYHFESDQSIWAPTLTRSTSHIPINELSIVTFNVLHSPQHPSPTRFGDIKSSILSLDCDVVCLQEVTDEFLFLLLRDELIRSRWRWCTRGLDLPMESERNLVILTREHLPFQWQRIPLSGKHKAASVLTLTINHPDTTDTPSMLIIAAIHLTAGLTPQALDTKAKELLKLTQLLRQNQPDAEWIIVGDTNLPSDFVLPENIGDTIEDVWESCHGSNASSVYNATYDPERNALASQTAREDRSPQRYDRLYIKRSGILQVRSIKLCDKSVASGGPASDHWPLCASFRLSPALSDSLPIPRGFEDPLPPRITLSHASLVRPEEGPKKGTPDLELWTFLQESGVILTTKDEQQRVSILQTLGEVVGAFSGVNAQDGQVQGSPSSGTGSSMSAPSVRLVLVPVGSAAMGLGFPDSDLDCIVVGNVSSATFWALCRQRLLSQTPLNGTKQCRVSLKRYVKDAVVKMMVLDVDGVKVDLQYCPAASLAERWSHFSSDLNEDVLLPVSSMRVLNAHRDRLRLQRCIPSPYIFELAHRSIKLYCIHRGIYAARFGYFGGIHLTILLCRVVETLPETATAYEVLKEFFRTYSSFDWSSEIASVSGVETTYRRTSREPMVILTPERPVVNVAANATILTRQVLGEELQRAHRLLCQSTPWSEVCGDAQAGLEAFLDEFQEFIKIDVSYWGGSCMSARALLGYIESRMIHLLVDLQTADASVIVRLWPQRLTDSVEVDLSKSSSVQGFYLLGLQRGRDSDGQKSLITTMQLFEDAVRKNEAYFDPISSFVSVAQCGKSSLARTVHVDTPSWSDDGYDDPQASDDEEDTQLGEVDVDQDLQDRTWRSNSSAKKRQKLKSKATPFVPAEKLRTSSDVFNRLMWDPHLNQNDYLIGYEDRFVGVKEMPLKSWKRNVEDEAFIPFHRVVHFRCKSTGELVWDRRSKADHVFGSGASSR